MLSELGFSPRRIPAGELARPRVPAVSSRPPALVVLTVDHDPVGEPAPGDVLRRLRADVDLAEVPLVVAMDELDAGAWIAALDVDELIVAPLRIEELGVRIARARMLHGILADEVIRLGSLAIDLAAYEVRLDGRPLELTHVEYRLLELLATHPRRVHTRERLISGMWGDDHASNARTVDGHVGRLRAKLGPEHGSRICTVRNVGYRFER